MLDPTIRNIDMFNSFDKLSKKEQVTPRY